MMLMLMQVMRIVRTVYGVVIVKDHFLLSAGNTVSNYG